MSRNVHFETREVGKTKVYRLKWTIPRFSNLLQSKSPKELRWDNYERITENYDLTIHLKIKFLGWNNDIIEIYYLFQKPIFVKIEMGSYLNVVDKRILVQTEYDKIGANSWQYLITLMKRDINTFKGKESFLLSNESLALHFEFTVRNDFNDLKESLHEADLSNDFKNLFVNELFPDVIMKSIDGKEYKVHKAVLSSRSDVLKCNFEHNTMECHTNIIESPFESETLSEVILFIYSDQTPRINDIPERLLAAANYYQLRRLKTLCEEALHKKLRVDNVMETLKLADLHLAVLLKQKCLEFIKDGQATLITKTEGWENESSIELIKTIYEFVMNNEEV